jgi:hypothetical protein
MSGDTEMIRLDFREEPLVNRVVAKRSLESALRAIASGSGEVVVDIGANVATTSWVDGFLAPLVATGARVTVILDSDVTRRHIERVFRARGVQVRVARNEYDASRGDVETIPAA